MLREPEEWGLGMLALEGAWPTSPGGGGTLCPEVTHPVRNEVGHRAGRGRSSGPCCLRLVGVSSPADSQPDLREQVSGYLWYQMSKITILEKGDLLS